MTYGATCGFRAWRRSWFVSVMHTSSCGASFTDATAHDVRTTEILTVAVLGRLPPLRLCKLLLGEHLHRDGSGRSITSEVVGGLGALCSGAGPIWLIRRSGRDLLDCTRVMGELCWLHFLEHPPNKLLLATQTCSLCPFSCRDLPTCQGEESPDGNRQTKTQAEEIGMKPSNEALPGKYI